MRSRSRRFGKRFSAILFWSQPRAKNQPPGGSAFSARKCRPRPIISSMERAPLRSSVSRLRPAASRWLCVSVKPGRTYLPFMSSTTVFESQSASMSLSPPTASMTPPRAKSACARPGCAIGYMTALIKAMESFRFPSAIRRCAPSLSYSSLTSSASVLMPKPVAPLT